MKPFLFLLLSGIAKIFDIIVSLFLGLLDLLEYAARTISLSFRLFGNMTSGGVLMGMVFVGIGTLTTSFGEGVGNILSGLFGYV